MARTLIRKLKNIVAITVFEYCSFTQKEQHIYNMLVVPVLTTLFTKFFSYIHFTHVEKLINNC